MQTDILIAGSGCAGLYCALNLPKNKNILMITKDIVEHSDSYLAQGGMCMLKDPDDFDSYFYDTMKAGHFENDTAAVETMIKESPDLVKDLLSMGVIFREMKMEILPIQERAPMPETESFITRTLQARRLQAIYTSSVRNLIILQLRNTGQWSIC